MNQQKSLSLAKHNKKRRMKNMRRWHSPSEFLQHFRQHFIILQTIAIEQNCIINHRGCISVYFGCIKKRREIWEKLGDERKWRGLSGRGHSYIL
jgi:hypothetical protein